ncbi:MAG: hypothetical protein J6X98_09750 [Bacteroidales bacterium]|nr:hypothetical protein [Bacteroidales bacterium]
MPEAWDVPRGAINTTKPAGEVWCWRRTPEVSISERCDGLCWSSRD